jgi:hypothetical protein
MDDIKPLKWSAYICILILLLATYIDAERELYRWSHPPKTRVHKTYQPPVDQTKWDYSWKSSITPIPESQN